MDILNWLYIRKQQLIKTTPDSTSDLLVLGADATFAKRGDKYKSYAMPLVDLAPALYDTANVTQATSNITAVTVNAHSGVITLFGSIAGPGNAIFTVNDVPVTASSKIYLTVQHSGAATAIATAAITNITTGAFTVQINNVGSTAMTAPKLHFVIID